MAFNGGGGFGGLGQPGQRIIEKVTPETEAKAIESKARLLSKSLYLIELCLLLPLVVAYLFWGYIVVFAIVQMFIVGFFVAWCKFLEWKASSYGKPYFVNTPLAVCILVQVLLGIFWVPIVSSIEVWHRVAVLMIFLSAYLMIPILASRLILSYRMGGEVSDQNPRMALSYPKWVWPWSNLGEVAHWDAGEPEPADVTETEETERTEWVAQTIRGRGGQGSWSFYVPPAGLSNLDVWHACQAIYSGHDEVHKVYMWPGLGGIVGLGSKKHGKLQKDWIDKGYATMLSNNKVVLLHKGVKVMEQVLAEPRPTRH